MNEENGESLVDSVDDITSDVEITQKAVEADKADQATEYLKKLRAEARQAKARTKTVEAEHAADKAQLAKLIERESVLKERYTTSELKAVATKANIIDPDVLKLMDRSGATYDDDGQITNASDLIEAFKASKPHLFSSQTSAGVHVPAPKATNTLALDWDNMSPAEYKANMRKIGAS